MLRLFFPLLLVVLLTNCAPPDQQYCAGFGVEGTPEYGKCLAYYHRQERSFKADRAVCETEADATYPRTLYDRGGFTPVSGTFWAGRYYPGGMIQIEPDYYHNAEVDRLRMRLIAPCMKKHGWASAKTWQENRQFVQPAKPQPSLDGKKAVPEVKKKAPAKEPSIKKVAVEPKPTIAKAPEAEKTTPIVTPVPEPASASIPTSMPAPIELPWLKQQPEVTPIYKGKAVSPAILPWLKK